MDLWGVTEEAGAVPSTYGTVACGLQQSPGVAVLLLFDLVDRCAKFGRSPVLPSVTPWHLFLQGCSWLPALCYVRFGALGEN